MDGGAAEAADGRTGTAAFAGGGRRREAAGDRFADRREPAGPCALAAAPEFGAPGLCPRREPRRWGGVPGELGAVALPRLAPDGLLRVLELVDEGHVAAVIAEEARVWIGVRFEGVDAVDESLLGVREALFVPIAALAPQEVVALLEEGGSLLEVVVDALVEPVDQREGKRTVDIALCAHHAVDGLDACEDTGTCHGEGDSV